MEPHHINAVRTAFVRLYEKGLIYRGHRIANVCKDCQTVLSDLEVEFKEVQARWTYVRYPVIDAEGESIVVATTRPETSWATWAWPCIPATPATSTWSASTCAFRT